MKCLSVVAAIVSKTPMCARHNDLVGTFLRVQSKRADDISLRTADNVADIKLSSAKSVYCSISHEPVLCPSYKQACPFVEADFLTVLLVGFVSGRDDTASQRGFM
jgi:hypothetical protein